MQVNDNDHLATECVLKARAELIMARRFYGVLVSNVEPVLSRKFPTMATDSKRHFFNPDFIMGLSKNHLGIVRPRQILMLGVQAHESEHDARHHGSRRGNRDPGKWNEACDFAINIDLIDEGFELPEGALIDAKYRGMSAEDIFRSRELDAEKEQQQQDKQDDADKDDGETSSDDSDGDDSNEAGDDEAEGDEGDESGDTGNGDGEGDGDGAGNGDGEGEGTGNGKGGGEGSQKSSGDPGGCGEVLDSATDASDLAEQDITWEKIVRQAASMAKAVGQLPGHITREIERANNPTRDWRDELREFAEQGALRTESWSRPNRRFAHSGLVLPSTQKDGVNKAALILDTSGSMDVIALAAVKTETQAMLDDGIIDEVVVIYGDTQVTRVDTYHSGDEIEFDPRGGGGTDMKPLFKYVADEHDDASLIVCFTDLYIGDAGPEPHCPTLFAVTGYPEAVKQLIADAPWGARGIDVGVH